MNSTRPTANPPGHESRAATLGAGALLVVAGLLSYGNSLGGQLVFDDPSSILENPTIRHLWPLTTVLSPPSGITVTGRPILNVSLAVNYVLGGATPWGYHALNLLIHVLAGLTLFGIVRRTLARSLRGESTVVALAVALLWTVHPLQTEAVTYLIQRAESLMGLFYLLTLYGFIRGTEAADPTLPGRTGLRSPRRWWFAFSLLACLGGMGTKEVMVSAPVIVLLYDRIFVARSFRQIWQERRWYHAALAATWLPLLWLVAGAGGDRGGTSGFDRGVSWGAYLLTQGPAIVTYLRLTLWPRPLVFYYPVDWVHGPLAWGETLVVLLLAIATLRALARATAIGFAGAFFFAILAPSSLVPGAEQTMAEHRMYLALAPVLVLLVLGFHRALGRVAFEQRLALFAVGAGGVALCFGGLTWARNRVYRSALTLWTDTVGTAARNPFAHYNLGVALLTASRVPEAIGQFRSALDLDSGYAPAHDSLGVALSRSGRIAEATAEYERAIGLQPNYGRAHMNLGVALAAAGRSRDALAQFESAARLDPGNPAVVVNYGGALVSANRAPEAIRLYEGALRHAPNVPELHFGLAAALAALGRWSDAITHDQAALRERPAYPEAHVNLGVALANLNRIDEAIGEFQAALRLNSGNTEARANLAAALAAQQRLAEAIAEYRQLLHVQPDKPEFQYNVAGVLAQAGDTRGAIEHYQRALALKPDYADASINLAFALARDGRGREAIAEFERALTLAPGDSDAHNGYGAILAESGRLTEAQRQFEEALRLNPDSADARENLERLRAARQR
ncbi:MAG TPA: tetratricopeptide repeat protein [Opitutaceae bacterium]|nr:tetratricopeptide repeat protein [Opitutaceae bacterium]